MRRVAALHDGHSLIVLLPVEVPKGLASRLVGAITDLDEPTAATLIESMSNEVIVRENSIRELIPFEPMNYDAAVLAALRTRRAASS